MSHNCYSYCKWLSESLEGHIKVLMQCHGHALFRVVSFVCGLVSHGHSEESLLESSENPRFDRCVLVMAECTTHHQAEVLYSHSGSINCCTVLSFQDIPECPPSQRKLSRLASCHSKTTLDSINGSLLPLDCLTMCMHCFNVMRCTALQHQQTGEGLNRQTYFVWMICSRLTLCQTSCAAQNWTRDVSWVCLMLYSSLVRLSMVCCEIDGRAPPACS